MITACPPTPSFSACHLATKPILSRSRCCCLQRSISNFAAFESCRRAHFVATSINTRLQAAQQKGHQADAAQSQHVPAFCDLQKLAKTRGMILSLKTLGPGYRIVCRDGASAQAEVPKALIWNKCAEQVFVQRTGNGLVNALEMMSPSSATGSESGTVLATTSGFVVPPLRLMHCDTMQVFTPRLGEADRERVRGGSFFGLSLLIVAAIMSHGHACGCTKAEMLAIKDDDYQHARLVRYYARLGFERVLEVGENGLADLPHLLVWGGAGTRMNINPQDFLQQWMPALRRSFRPLEQHESLQSSS